MIFYKFIECPCCEVWIATRLSDPIGEIGFCMIPNPAMTLS